MNEGSQSVPSSVKNLFSSLPGLPWEQTLSNKDYYSFSKVSIKKKKKSIFKKLINLVITSILIDL